MKSILIIFLFFLIPTLSFSKIHRPGLLTADYGIVTNQDLDEEEAGCTEVKDFAHQNGCLAYWQCLPTKAAKVTCNDLGPDDSPSVKDHIGELSFILVDKNEIHDFSLRHNFGMSDCKALKHSILNVMKYQTIVCVLGLYAEKENNTSYWIIDRVKSKRGESAWFHREKMKIKPIF